eukprot:TRINITY_DN7475_c0_g2_i3.p1 TRINITY_DN7475_c0_g2~~TRINITY_DN7475_c0_g2_i3.p1  ORF type:complete len:420 (+),score=113.47 TRINITY_DN7475_c0_g2_i3:90-1349(+)
MARRGKSRLLLAVGAAAAVSLTLKGTSPEFLQLDHSLDVPCFCGASTTQISNARCHNSASKLGSGYSTTSCQAAEKTLDEIADDVEALVAQLYPKDNSPSDEYNGRSVASPPASQAPEFVQGIAPKVYDAEVLPRTLTQPVAPPVQDGYRSDSSRLDSNVQRQGLEGRLQQEGEDKAELLRQQRLQEMELEELRRQQGELQQKMEEESLQLQKQDKDLPRPPQPSAPELSTPRSTTEQSADELASFASSSSTDEDEGAKGGSLMQAAIATGMRPAPEYGSDTYVASIGQISKLVDAKLDKARATHFAGMQALQRYVMQLEGDLDAKEEEFRVIEDELKEEKLKAKAATSNTYATKKAAAANEAAAASEEEAASLRDELDRAREAQQAAETQLAQEAQRAQVAETQLRNLVDKLRQAKMR